MAIVISKLSSDGNRRVPGVDSALYPALGELTATFALLENVIKDGIGSCLFYYGNVEGDLTDPITAQLSFRRLVELLRCLVVTKFQPDSDTEMLHELCKKALALEHERNRITHSYWGQSSAGDAVRMKTTANSKGVKYQREEHSQEAIEATAHRMGELAYQFRELFKEFSDPESEQEYLEKLQGFCSMHLQDSSKHAR